MYQYVSVCERTMSGSRVLLSLVVYSIGLLALVCVPSSHLVETRQDHTQTTCVHTAHNLCFMYIVSACIITLLVLVDTKESDSAVK